jgi:hypothetical protein
MFFTRVGESFAKRFADNGEHEAALCFDVLFDPLINGGPPIHRRRGRRDVELRRLGLGLGLVGRPVAQRLRRRQVGLGLARQRLARFIKDLASAPIAIFVFVVVGHGGSPIHGVDDGDAAGNGGPSAFGANPDADQPLLKNRISRLREGTAGGDNFGRAGFEVDQRLFCRFDFG